MLFNSIEFAIFLPLVFSLYWVTGSERVRSQNILLILSSYLFYGWWDWRFLSLIAISSIVDYLVGIGLSQSENTRNRRLLLMASISVNIGILGFFKYFNFFSLSFQEAFTFFGNPITDTFLLDVLLPVGISFYTFQTLSYSIDVYNRKLNATTDIVAFFAFVCFFPQLVAGPIERAKNLLPQFLARREFSYANASDGMRQIIWGLFKKIVIADNCGIYADDIFSNYESLSGSTLLLGALFFTFQIYGDFSGYSDIAIGTSRLFGFNLMRNFAFPYFSRDIAEFWRRWHISLSSWFRDYVYIPLGGSRGPRYLTVRNIFIIFLLSGFWHGANWTFIVWGALNAIYFLPLFLAKKNRINTDIVAKGKSLPSLRELIQIGLTFFLTVIAWIFFRAESVGDALQYLSIVFSKSLFVYPEVGVGMERTLAFILVLLLVEWVQREKQHGLQIESRANNAVFRWGAYYALLFAIVQLGGSPQQFIYFQF
jgi:D-alanyl-lipoteichoic acid acyltransferase DltB (MBOAT superfamily)